MLKTRHCGKQVFIKDWEQWLDEFLRFNERRVLPDAGKVSKQTAEEHAKSEYEKFEVRRREHKETLGEADYVKQLEEAAKQLPPENNLRESSSPADKGGSDSSDVQDPFPCTRSCVGKK